MKKVNIFWLLFSVFSFLPVIFALSMSLFVRRLPDVGQPHENTQVWVYKDHPISQTFTPKNNGLNVITIYLKNVSLRNQEPFKFVLSDKSVPIREINLSGYNIGDGDNVRFQFDPIMNSKDLPLTLTLSSDSSQSKAIGVGFSEPSQSIAYLTYYYPTSRLQVLKTVTISFIRKLFNFL